MAIINPPSYLQGRNDHSAQTDRLAESALILPNGAGNTWSPGVRGSLDLKVNPQGTPNMTVSVAAGQAFVPCVSALNGLYHVVNDAATNLTIAAAHATLNRIDRIIVRINDAAISGATNSAVLEVVQGSAASSPSLPAVTGNYLELARVTVSAAMSSVAAGAITDVRRQTVALGGVLPVANDTVRGELTPAVGQIVWNAGTNRLEVWNGTTWIDPTASRYKSGSQEVTAGATSATHNITFGGAAFTEIPRVVTDIKNGGSLDNTWASRAIAVTATGFTIFVRGAGTPATVTVDWIATTIGNS